MTERTKKIKGLINGQVDMGTFGLVELELLDIENENEALRKHAVSGRSEQLVSFLKWYVKDEMMRKEKELVTSIVERYLNETNCH